MRETSLEMKQLLAESPLRRPAFAGVAAIVFVILFAYGAYNLIWPLYGGAPRMIQAFVISALLAILASVPAIFLLWFLDRREHESPLLLAGAAMWGAVISASLSLVFSNTLYGYMLGVAQRNGGMVLGMSTSAFTSAVTSPIVEEIVKGIAILILFLLLRSDFDDMRDGLLYGAMVGLGFNAAQYTVFLLQEFALSGTPPYLSLGSLHFVFAGVNGHLVYSALLGAGFGLARQTNNRRLKLLAPLGGIALAIYANMMMNTLGSKVINEIVRVFTGERLFFATTPPVIVWVAAAAGNLAAELWAYLLLAIAIYQSEHWEIETIRQHLFGEVNIAVTMEEYEQIQDEKPFRIRRVAGYPPKIAEAIRSAQNELAFRKWHTEQAGKNVEEDDLVNAWRARIAQLRASAESPTLQS